MEICLSAAVQLLDIGLCLLGRGFFARAEKSRAIM